MVDNFEKEDFQDLETFDTKGLILDYLNHWKWFALSVVVCLALGVLYIAKTIPVYQIDAGIYLNATEDQTANPFSLDKGASLIDMKSFIDETELEILKSRNTMVKIVDSLDLCYYYYQNNALRNVPLYQDNAVVVELDSASLQNLNAEINVKVSPKSDDKFDIRIKSEFEHDTEKVSVDDVTLPCEIALSNGTLTVSRSPMIPEMEYEELVQIVSPRVRAKELSKNISIEFTKKSDKIVSVAYKDQVVQRGTDVVNALLDFYNRSIIEDKNRSAVQTEAFILDRLVMINDELKMLKLAFSSIVRLITLPISRLKAHSTSHSPATIKLSLPRKRPTWKFLTI